MWRMTWQAFNSINEDTRCVGRRGNHYLSCPTAAVDTNAHTSGRMPPPPPSSSAATAAPRDPCGVAASGARPWPPPPVAGPGAPQVSTADGSSESRDASGGARSRVEGVEAGSGSGGGGTLARAEASASHRAIEAQFEIESKI